MTGSDAWLLECGDSLRIAVGDHEMVEYIQGPFCYSVPVSPSYCNQVLFWQEKFVPVMDLAALHDKPVDQSSSVVCLLNYQPEPDKPLLQLAIRVNRAPEKIRVDDDQACELSEQFNNNPLGSVVLSCFVHDENETVIIDISRLCSAEFRDLVNIT